MKIINHTLGFPRIGVKRELKKALENYWSNKINKKELFKIGANLRKKHWEQQKKCGIDLIPVGDFAWYDHMLTTSLMIGNIPKRYISDTLNIDTLFRIGRGKSQKSSNIDAEASEMTKWFNTNYHYIVPELEKNTTFKLSWLQLFDEIDEAIALNYKIKPVIIGPLTYLYLGKIKGNYFDKLEMLPKIIEVYKNILKKISEKNILWVQIDEPILTLDLSDNWIIAFKKVYNHLSKNNKLKILLTTYFGSIMHNLKKISKIKIHGIHIDLIHGKYTAKDIELFPKDWILSLGIINGRNIWKSDLNKWFKYIKKIFIKNKNIWIGTSCSLLHTPVDIKFENHLNKEIKNWFAFAIQKCEELSILKNSLNNNNITDVKKWSEAIASRSHSNIINNKIVSEKVKLIKNSKQQRKSKYDIREKLQKEYLNLPYFPTTTIGSFPQTKLIRKIRMDFKKNLINKYEYEKKIFQQIKSIILKQESLDLDVLVHGEPERNDMVEYFGEKLNGFVFTKNGWVQSYGSRCVKPPIIIGDVSRTENMTVKWTKYAQSLTKKPVKGMLTGPITILFWSFIREDIPKEDIAIQIALSIKEEVKDLEKSGIKIIQIDEPALREGLPLRQSEWEHYLKWAINSFRISSSQVNDKTQIHTHMCYSEFNDIIKSIADLDADVITIETSRSDMKLLESFKTFNYPNSIGPGVYDIHSPNIPSIKSIENLVLKALKYISYKKLWINPDCGLKTRTWEETENALKNMVQATKKIRKFYKI